ncbi:hypothetical protein Aduo_013167 [Ancylostoma duodenale]
MIMLFERLSIVNEPLVVPIAKVTSEKDRGDDWEYELEHTSYAKRYSIYSYFPERIKIPKKCNTRLTVWKEYVLGYTYSVSYFYYYNFARPKNELTADERRMMGLD